MVQHCALPVLSRTGKQGIKQATQLLLADLVGAFGCMDDLHFLQDDSLCKPELADEAKTKARKESVRENSVSHHSEDDCALLDDFSRVAPAHCMRVFLRDKASQRYVSIAELGVDASVACVMTERPVSLFICHSSPSASSSSGKGPKRSPLADGSSTKGGRDGYGSSVVTLGFEHEGVPAFQRFLSLRRSENRLALVALEALSKTENWLESQKQRGTRELNCNSDRFGSWEEFRWYPDATVQHAVTGLWLYVDPSNPVDITLDASRRSVWEVAPAT